MEIQICQVVAITKPRVSYDHLENIGVRLKDLITREEFWINQYLAHETKVEYADYIRLVDGYKMTILTETPDFDF